MHERPTSLGLYLKDPEKRVLAVPPPLEAQAAEYKSTFFQPGTAVPCSPCTHDAKMLTWVQDLTSAWVLVRAADSISGSSVRLSARKRA